MKKGAVGVAGIKKSHRGKALFLGSGRKRLARGRGRGRPVAAAARAIEETKNKKSTPNFILRTCLGPASRRCGP